MRNAKSSFINQWEQPLGIFLKRNSAYGIIWRYMVQPPFSKRAALQAIACFKTRGLHTFIYKFQEAHFVEAK